MRLPIDWGGCRGVNDRYATEGRGGGSGRFACECGWEIQAASPFRWPGRADSALSSPRLWRFSSGLPAALARCADRAPRCRVEIGSPPGATERVPFRPASQYSLCTLVPIALRRIGMASPEGRKVSPTVFELVGADGPDSHRLEQLIRFVSATPASIIDDVHVLYPSRPSSACPRGLRYDGEDRYTALLVRTDVSSESRSPLASDCAPGENSPPRGVIPSADAFLAALWQGTLVRSGGYFFSYVLPDGAGLPSDLFNEDDLGEIAILVVYRPDAVTGREGDAVRDFMNAVLVGDTFDPVNEWVGLVALPQEPPVPPGDESGGAPDSPPPPAPPVGEGEGDDEVLGMDRWPATVCDHRFVARADLPGAELRIELRFDSSRYQPGSRDEENWRQQAEVDRQVYANIHRQLRRTTRDGTAAERILTRCSLAAEQLAEVGAAEREAIMSYVLAAERYLEGLADPNAPSAPEPPPAVTLVRPFRPLTAPAIVRLEVGLRRERHASPGPPESDAPDAGRVADCAIGPRLTASGPNAPCSLAEYASAFEAACESAEVCWRLALGPPRTAPGAADGRDTLWAVRLGKHDGQAFRAVLEEPAAFFSLAPLSTTLLSQGDVPLYSFSPEAGLSKAPDRKQLFTGVELDLWARRLFEAIDRLLEPSFAVAAFWVDLRSGTSHWDRILDAKRRLVEAVANGLCPVLSQPSLDCANDRDRFDAARHALRQRLFSRLADAYAIDAIVQYPVRVAAPAAPPEAIPPRWRGTVSAADPAGRAGGDQEYPFTLSLDSPASSLSFAFAAPEACRQSSYDASFRFTPTQIERAIRPHSLLQDVETSCRLRFFHPPAPLASAANATTIQTEIPLPLREYPTPPRPVAQDTSGWRPDGDATTALRQAKRWTYRFSYSQTLSTRDRLDAEVRFDAPHTLERAPGPDSSDLFVGLARLEFVLGELESVFAADLARVGVATAVDAPELRRARHALEAFAFLLTGLDQRWSAWDGVRRAGESSASPAGERLAFSIREDSIVVPLGGDSPGNAQTAFRVTVTCPDGLPSGLTAPPQLVFDGYTPVRVIPGPAAEAPGQARKAPGDGGAAPRPATGAVPAPSDDVVRGVAWVFRWNRTASGPARYLSWDEARALPQRTVELPPLDVLRHPGAWAGLRTVRNAQLVGPDNPTRLPYIYTSPFTRFANATQPLLDADWAIDLAELPTGAAQVRPLRDHLSALFGGLFDSCSILDPQVRIEIRYAYPLTAGILASAVELPVALIPPTQVEIPDGQPGSPPPCGSGAQPLARFILALAARIEGWYREARPPTPAAVFVLDVTVDTPAGDGPRPLLRLRNLRLPLAMIEGL